MFVCSFHPGSSMGHNRDESRKESAMRCTETHDHIPIRRLPAHERRQDLPPPGAGDRRSQTPTPTPPTPTGQPRQQRLGC